jgi:hypothetical protein
LSSTAPRSSTPNPSDPGAPGRRRALGTLAFALVLAMTTWFSATAVVPQLRVEWNLTPGTAAWLTITVQLGFVAGSLLSDATNLSDIASPRVVIFAGARAAMVNLILLVAGGPGVAIPARFATGFFLAASTLRPSSSWRRGSARGAASPSASSSGRSCSGLRSLTSSTASGARSRRRRRHHLAANVAGGALATGVRDGPFPFPGDLRPASGGPRVRQPRGQACIVRLLRPHVGAVRDVGVVRGVLRRRHATGPAPYAAFAVIGIGALGNWRRARRSLGAHPGRPRR